MKKLIYGVFAGLMVATALSGCVSLGMSQQDSETTYTVAANVTAVVLASGKYNGDQAGQACEADNLEYNILISTRNVADNVNYLPADTAHVKLHAAGIAFNPVVCAVPSK